MCFCSFGEENSKFAVLFPFAIFQMEMPILKLKSNVMHEFYFYFFFKRISLCDAAVQEFKMNSTAQKPQQQKVSLNDARCDCVVTRIDFNSALQMNGKNKRVTKRNGPTCTVC